MTARALGVRGRGSAALHRRRGARAGSLRAAITPRWRRDPADSIRDGIVVNLAAATAEGVQFDAGLLQLARKVGATRL
jgi:hypothetical protein